MKNHYVFNVALACALLGVTACTPAASKEKEAPSAEAKPAAAETGPKVAAAKTEAAAATPSPDGVLIAEKNVVHLEASDDMKFNAKEIRVKAGSKVKVYLKHVGKLGAEVMGHNFVLLKPGVDMKQFATDAMTAGATDYIPRVDDVIASTRVVGGGRRASVTFDAPAPGTYDFLCSFPGHYSMMQGKFIVE
ncbi:MAG: azurin [Polyangiaceae bacterium]|nr:azurin [Polyangiaceae bacterium]